jgi:putative ABC transport system permease protein
MRLALWLRFAQRDLRSGFQGFWIFLSCLALGTATVAIVGALAATVQRGISEQGQALLGGDFEVSLVHRQATVEELGFLAASGEVSRVATLRSMAMAADTATLVEVKAIDGGYPLYGDVRLDGSGTLADVLDRRGGIFGAAADPLLIGRLGIAIGDRIRLGTAEIEIRAAIAAEPDRISDGFILGPRLLVSEAGLAATGLIQPGSLITWQYRLKLPGNPKASAVKAAIAAVEAAFPKAGWRIRGRHNAAPGTGRFIERLGLFLSFAGLAALIVGGAGIANAVRAFIGRRTATIATLKCLGAASRDVFGIYLSETLMVAIVAIALGVALGAAAPFVAGATLAGLIPVPIAGRIEVAPLLVAAGLAVLVTVVFALWPLARARRVAASALFRSRVQPIHGWPGAGDFLAMAAALAAIAAIALAGFGERRLTVWYLCGLAGAYVLLAGLARTMVAAAGAAPRASSAIWRYAIANLHRPGAASVSVIMALGLGLSLFVTLALTDRTVSGELRAGIPERAPAYFFLDVRNTELADFIAALKAEPGVTAVASAPMLRGRITRVKGQPAEQVKALPDAAWALRGDRGLTYAKALPPGSKLVAGDWWPEQYDGPPLVSLVAEIAEGIGVGVGDAITVNVLGREITATIANLRDVNWRSLGINFVMVFTPNTLKAAPHSHIVTAEMEGGEEAGLLNRMARRFPAATAVRVKDALAIVSDLIGRMIGAVRGASVLTLLTGVLVLVGALAAGLGERHYDAVVLKTYGASRRQLIGAFVIEYAALGTAAAVFGILAGSAASWFLARFILEMPWRFSPAVALATSIAAMAVTVAAGLAVTWSALSARPAAYLRNE